MFSDTSSVFKMVKYGILKKKKVSSSILSEYRIVLLTVNMFTLQLKNTSVLIHFTR